MLGTKKIFQRFVQTSVAYFVLKEGTIADQGRTRRILRESKMKMKEMNQAGVTH